MKKSLLILGAGGYGRVAYEIAQAMEAFDQIAFLDDKKPGAVGALADHIALRRDFDCAFVAIGDPHLRLHWLDRLEQAGYELPVLIHPAAWVSPSASCGAGSVIEPMAVVNTSAVIGRGTLLCAGCVVNHDAFIMPGCQIDCNAVVASGTTVPHNTKVPSCTIYDNKMKDGVIVCTTSMLKG